MQKKTVSGSGKSPEPDGRVSLNRDTRKRSAPGRSPGGPKGSKPDKQGGSGAGRQEGGSGAGRER